jgi:FAD/FMN-containing dehydrogenase
LSGDGRVVVASPDNEHVGLFRGFPNSYGTLGYVLRLTIELEPVQPFVRLRHLRFGTADELLSALAQACRTRAADFVDATVFSPAESYLTLATFVDNAPHVSDYTHMGIYYRSIQTRTEDYLTVRDYLWRWDTDWFWCSRAFGVQNPVVRRLWPRRYRRSDVYRAMVAFDRRHDLTGRLARLRGRRPEEPVVQDVEIPIDATGKFLEIFHRDVGITPIWLCPLMLRSSQAWPLYPLEPDELYVNVGFWSSAPLTADQPADHHNRLIEEVVSALGGHKSLYSTVHYSAEEFWRRYNGPAYQEVKRAYDPQGRLPNLYQKVAATTQ